MSINFFSLKYSYIKLIKKLDNDVKTSNYNVHDKYYQKLNLLKYSLNIELQ